MHIDNAFQAATLTHISCHCRRKDKSETRYDVLDQLVGPFDAWLWGTVNS